LEAMSAPDGSLVCRIVVPFASAFEERQNMDLPADLGPYISDWTVLLGRPTTGKDEIGDRLNSLGVNVLNAEDIVTVLAKADATQRLEAIVLDKRLIIQEASALLKAILKLCPGAGIVVLCDDPATEEQELTSDVVFTSTESQPNQVILSIIEARSLAMKRKDR